ncbi:MAG: RNA polymerase sigma factor [Pirellulaceae bacterium]
MTDDLRLLVRRCLDGEQSAMQQLVERFRNQVFGLCFRMLGQRQDAEDATQETLLRMLRSLGRWDPARDFEPWLLAIAGNRCRTALASRMNRPKPQEIIEPVADHRDNDHQRALLAEEVARALDRIRDEYRQAFLLFHEQQLSYQEIAAALDCPVGTAKTWVHRARQGLIAQLSQRGVVEERRNEVRRVSS